MDLAYFEGHNCVIAKDQKQYRPLPAWRKPYDKEGTTVCCWNLTWKERFQILLTGRVWHKVLTFGQPLQPQLLSAEKFPEQP